MAAPLMNATLVIAADLMQPMHPRQAQAIVLGQLEKAGYGAAFLRLEDNALHWHFDLAHVSPVALDALKERLHVIPVPLMPFALDKSSFLRETISSLSVRYFDLEHMWNAGASGTDAWQASAAIMRALGIRRDIHIPVVHNGQPLGLLVLWSDDLGPEDCEVAGFLGRILGAALQRTGLPDGRQSALASREALIALQSVIATLAVDQPIEQSLAAIRDAMSRAVPGLLPPIFAMRDFDKDEWNWNSILPEWAAPLIREVLGNVSDRVRIPVGASQFWETLAGGEPVFVTDAAQLAGHILSPQAVRAIQKTLGVGTVAIFPLASGGSVLGLMVVCARKDAWDDEERDLLRACASNVALALNNAHLYMRQQQLVRRMTQSLNRAENILLPVSPDQRLQTIVDEALDILNADAGALYGVHERSGEVKPIAYRGISERYVQLVCEHFASLKVGRVASLRVPTRVDDMLSDDVPDSVRAGVLEEGLRCFMAFPLIARGHFRGALVLYRKRPLPFSEGAALGGHAYAIISAMSYEALRLMDNLGRRLAEAEVLRQILHDLSGEYDLVSVCRAILTHACRLTDSDSSALYLWDLTTQRLVDQAGTYHGEPLDRATILKSGEGLAGTVFERGEPVMLEDYYTWPRSIPFARRKAVGPALGVPIRMGGEIIGVIGLMRDVPKPTYDDEDLELAEALADEVALSVAQARLKDERDRQREFAQRILDSVPSLLVVCEADTTNTILVNQHFLKTTGWTREEVIGLPWLDRCIPAAWRDPLLEVARSLRDQEGGYRFFNPILARDGREIAVRWYNTIVRGEDGQPLYIVASGIVADDQG